MGSVTVNMHHLHQRRRVWYVELDVPAVLRGKLGRRLTRTTGATDPLVAVQKRDAILSEFQARIARAHAEASLPAGASTLAFLERAAAEAEVKAQRLILQAAQERDSARWALNQIALLERRPPATRDHPASAVGHTYKDAAEACIASKRRAWKGKDNWTPLMRLYAYPTLADVPVDEITSEMVLRVLEPIWHRIPATGRSLQRMIENILSYARARGWRHGDNPAAWADNLQFTLPATSNSKPAGHHPALDWRQLPAFMAKLATNETTAGRALAFTILCACRKGETFGSTWDEFDINTKLWTIPAARMKANREHRIPLSDAALAILAEMRGRSLPRHRGLVFAGQKGRLSNTTFYRVINERLGVTDAVGHGFRSTFRSWCADHNHPADIAEMALAHVTGSQTERAYNRSDLLDRRRGLMDQWAEFCVNGN
jgi:integrase